MKRLTTIAAAMLLGVFAMPPVTIADDDGHKQRLHSMQKTFEAAKMAAKRLPTFKDGMVVQRHRAAPSDLDYDSFGYWLNAAPRPNARPPIGVWAAGPIGWSAPTLPVSGAALYNGSAEGFIAKHNKSSPLPQQANIRFQGTFTAPVVLSATFDPVITRTGGPVIVGYFGASAGGAIEATGQYIRTTNPGGSGPMNMSLSYGVFLSAPLNSDGSWSSTTVKMKLPGVSRDALPKTGGAWGGNLIAGGAFPASAIGEKAIGTFGAWMTEGNGNKTVLLGAFSTGPGVPAVISRSDNYCSAITGTGVCGSPEFNEILRRASGQEE